MAAPLFPFDFDALVDAVADRVADKVLERLPASSSTTKEALLLTTEDTAVMLGRTVPAVDHLIREGKLKVVRIDRRVFIDRRDILSLIERNKKEV